jgi:hypothetical protein
MRSNWKWLVVLTVTVALTAVGRADEEIIPNGVTLQLILLRQKSVQEDLKLTPEASKAVADFTKKESESYFKALKLDEKERNAKFEELEKNNKKFLEDTLSAAQVKRLGQIALQVSGLRHLTKPEAAKALNLTEEQQAKFKDMLKTAGKELEEIFAAKDREGKTEKLAKLREDVNKKIEALLTDEQKAKAKEFIGEPFTGKLVFEEPEQD